MSLAVVTAAEMRELDRVTIEELGVPGVVLMEVAGRGVAELVEQLAPALLGWRVGVFCGAGNNGGDGYVAARHLALRGADVTIFMLAGRERIRGDALINLKTAEKLELPFTDLTEEAACAELSDELLGYDCLVDALLGTGLSSEVRGRYRSVIEVMNASCLQTIAVDIPSGLSADTGQPLGIAVEADATATFAYPKLGLVSHPGPEFTGDVHVVDIGIPPLLVERQGLRCRLLEEADVVELLPLRGMGGHKGSYGHVLAVAGSPGKSGAAVLCARAAARVGAGLVTVATTADARDAVAAQSLETMCEVYAPVAEDFDAGPASARLLELTAGKQAVVVGPGVPTSAEFLELLRELVTELSVPLVLDADALNHLAGRPSLLRDAAGPVIVTPHPGEMARLTGTSSTEVQADRAAAARRLAEEHGVFVVLKGARSVLAAPDGELWINPTGNPGMASGGTGDVLTGLVGGLLAQGLAPFDALRAAVYLHGEAGDRVAEELGERALLAGDLLDAIPLILQEWESDRDLLL